MSVVPKLASPFPCSSDGIFMSGKPSKISNFGVVLISAGAGTITSFASSESAGFTSEAAGAAAVSIRGVLYTTGIVLCSFWPEKKFWCDRIEQFDFSFDKVASE
jgi:hypothetical protein